MGTTYQQWVVEVQFLAIDDGHHKTCCHHDQDNQQNDIGVVSQNTGIAARKTYIHGHNKHGHVSQQYAVKTGHIVQSE